ncbi:hypothetical protein K3495_g14770 [Podosphaera aphanis]|nr:hypothetical protein K3495_g14770 [Podosphaera aphanis]
MFGLINSHSANNRQVLQDFRGQLNDKEREIHKLRKIVENKKAEISSLQQQLASAASEKSQAQLQPPLPPQVIVQQPAQPSTVYVDRPPAQDPFTGDQKDIVKRHIEYTTWKFKLVSKWSLNSTTFDSEFKKICDAINWLKGDAYNRIQSKIALFFSNTENLSNGPWPTSTSFFSELDSKYLTADIVSLARNSLNNLKMTGKLKDFPSFVSEFERLADQGELSSSMCHGSTKSARGN